MWVGYLPGMARGTQPGVAPFLANTKATSASTDTVTLAVGKQKHPATNAGDKDSLKSNRAPLTA